MKGTTLQTGKGVMFEGDKIDIGDVCYVEHVTKSVDQLCAVLGGNYSDPKTELGNARIKSLASGVIVAVRSPMHEEEDEVTRVYTRTNNVEKAVHSLEGRDKGPDILVPPMDMPTGRIAVWRLGVVEGGFWEF